MRVKIPLSKVFAGEIQLDKSMVDELQTKESSAESCPRHRRIERRCGCEEVGGRLGKQLASVMESLAELSKNVDALAAKQTDLDERVSALLSKVKRRPKPEEPAPSAAASYPPVNYWETSGYAPSGYPAGYGPMPCNSMAMAGSTSYGSPSYGSPSYGSPSYGSPSYGSPPQAFDEVGGGRLVDLANRRVPTSPIFTRTVHSNNWAPKSDAVAPSLAHV